MKKICIGLEWGAYPIYELDENDNIVDDISAEELGFSDEFAKKIQIMQEMYNDLFVNNEKEFSYIGDKKSDEIKRIKEIYNDISIEFCSKLKDKYDIKVLEFDI